MDCKRLPNTEGRLLKSLLDPNPDMVPRFSTRVDEIHAEISLRPTVAQRLVRYRLTLVPRFRRPHAARFFSVPLYQQVDALSDELLAELQAMVVRPLPQQVNPLVHYRPPDELVRPAGGGGAGAWGEGERVDVDEPSEIHHLKRAQELLVGFAGEAD